jgi:hypothetical protein
VIVFGDYNISPVGWVDARVRPAQLTFSRKAKQSLINDCGACPVRREETRFCNDS